MSVSSKRRVESDVASPTIDNSPDCSEVYYPIFFLGVRSVELRFTNLVSR